MENEQYISQKPVFEREQILSYKGSLIFLMLMFFFLI